MQADLVDEAKRLIINAQQAQRFGSDRCSVRKILRRAAATLKVADIADDDLIADIGPNRRAIYANAEIRRSSLERTGRRVRNRTIQRRHQSPEKQSPKQRFSTPAAATPWQRSINTRSASVPTPRPAARQPGIPGRQGTPFCSIGAELTL
jgi:hypothetical protein